MKKPVSLSGEKDPAACNVSSARQGREVAQKNPSPRPSFSTFEIVPVLTARRMERIFRCRVRGALDKA